MVGTRLAQYVGKQMGAGARLPLLIWAVAGLAGSTKFMSREVTPIVQSAWCCVSGATAARASVGGPHQVG